MKIVDVRTKAIEYAKDLAVARILQPIEILEWADIFYKYIITGAFGGKIEQEDIVYKYIIKGEFGGKNEADKKTKPSEISTQQARQLSVEESARSIEEVIEQPVTDAASLMRWAKEHGMMPSQVRKEAGLAPLEGITPEKAMMAFQIIKGIIEKEN